MLPSEVFNRIPIAAGFSLRIYWWQVRKEKKRWISYKGRPRIVSSIIFYRRRQRKRFPWCGIAMRGHFLSVDFVRLD
jgi:hypothetical protein